MRRIKAILEYDGTAFSGWQRQPDKHSIQEMVELALEKLFQRPVRISAAGRTDAGVHAAGQVMSFLTDSSISPRGILRGTNTFLPEAIRLIEVSEVPESFNPRRDAVLRWYRYRVMNRTTAPVLGRHFITHIPYRLDYGRLEKATSLLLGRHDFAGFRSSQCSAKRTHLTLETFDVSRARDIVIFDLQCRSFLQNMVRILVGAVIEVARGKIPISLIARTLKSGCRDPRIPTAPACGLTLMKVYYAGDQKG